MLVDRLGVSQLFGMIWSLQGLHFHRGTSLHFGIYLMGWYNCITLYNYHRDSKSPILKGRTDISCFITFWLKRNMAMFIKPSQPGSTKTPLSARNHLRSGSFTSAQQPIWRLANAHAENDGDTLGKCLGMLFFFQLKIGENPDWWIFVWSFYIKT